MDRLFANRLVRAYLIIAVGAVLFMLRRQFFPTFFELQGLPFEIAVPSVMNGCYANPSFIRCADAGIVVVTIVGVIIALGWGSLGMTVFAVILSIAPLLLYFALSPIWAPLIALVIIPIALELGLWILAPRSPPSET
jgi:hypothetical protein